MDRGEDLRDESDDFVVADYTEQPKKVQIRKFNGLSYVSLREREKDAIRTLKDPSAAHRHEKDRRDLNSITFSKWVRRQK